MYFAFIWWKMLTIWRHDDQVNKDGPRLIRRVFSSLIQFGSNFLRKAVALISLSPWVLGKCSPGSLPQMSSLLQATPSAWTNCRSNLQASQTFLARNLVVAANWVPLCPSRGLAPGAGLCFGHSASLMEPMSRLVVFVSLLGSSS